MMAARAASGASELPRSAGAAEEAAAQAAAALEGRPVDLAVVFVSPEHAGEAEAIAATIHQILHPRVLAGSTTETVIGGDRELEGLPGISLLAASLPGADVSAYPIGAAIEPDGAVLTVPASFAPPAAGEGVALLMADPFSFPVAGFLDVLAADWGGALAVGGLASGGVTGGDHALLCDDTVLRGGAVVVTVSGTAELRAVVSQGCAPIGPEMVVTAADGHVLTELAGRPAYERLVEIVSGLSAEEQLLAQRGVMAGLVIDENRADYGRDDYLIRGMMGADPRTGTLVVSDPPRIGQTLRFHVRDADSADRDLREALRSELRTVAGRVVGGALFACNGRGSGMFGLPDHDAGVAAEELAVPVAGMFCAGEIGPVGGRTFVHGFTATMALLVDTRAAEPAQESGRAVVERSSRGRSSTIS
jgi:small ligand-binding sensory domain FIST